MIATKNNHKKVENTGQNRSINRHQWDYELLRQKLGDNESLECHVYEKIKARIELRTSQLAFHPNATQFTLHLSDTFFVFISDEISNFLELVPICIGFVRPLLFNANVICLIFG